MKLKRHRIEGIDWMPARWTGGTITPELVIIHDTAGRLDEGNAEDYLAENDVKVSVHFVISRTGKVTQQVATNRRANHAGRSEYHGKKGANNFSIGIELVNTGRMEKVSDKVSITWFKTKLNNDAFEIRYAKTPEHGHGMWMDYTDDQLVALTELLVALFNGIDTLKDIRGHWYVSPGRKADPNPLFPMAELRSLILGREEPSEDELDHGEANEGEKFVTTFTGGDTLNLRRWPSYNPNVIARIPDETILPVLKDGKFGGEHWYKVRYAGHEGWISAAYAELISE